MINLSKSGNTIVFVFDNNDHYLQQGTIEVPVNSLSLVTDNSQMATFKKAASNDIFVSALYSDFGMTKEQLISFYKDNMVGGGGGGGDIPTEEIQEMIDESLSSATSGYADSVIYNSTSHYVEFYHNGTGGTKVYEFDASDFIVDGMIDDVRIETISGTSYLVIDFNTASGKEDIQIPLTDIFDPSNYYTKSEVDSALSGKADTTAVTEAISEAISGKADTSAVTESINAAVSGKVDTSTFETYSGNVESALSGKQDTLSAGTNITISGNVISAEGGGKAIEAGRGISLTTGETADTVSFNLPIYQGKGNNSISITQPSGTTQFSNNVSGYSTTAIGAGLKVTNHCETAMGLYNVNTNVIDGTPFGNSDATLFSVGNGSGTNQRHNAIEVKQNGDIYIADTNNTSYADFYNKPMIKLQDALSGGSITVSSAITSGDTNAVAGGAVYDKFDEVETVTAAALNQLNDDIASVSGAIPTTTSAVTSGSTAVVESGAVYEQFGGLKLQKVTQAEYDALVSGGTVDSMTLYVVTNS